MTIQLSQVLLILALILFILYVYRLRSILLERIIYLLCGMAGIVLVIYPDLSTLIANRLGIGRGVDLLIYLFIMVALFYAVSLMARIRRLERQLTALVRRQALDHPQNGDPQEGADRLEQQEKK